MLKLVGLLARLYLYVAFAWLISPVDRLNCA
jgi:hypothetical protein